eukprot:gene3732-1217_t
MIYSSQERQYVALSLPPELRPDIAETPRNITTKDALLVRQQYREWYKHATPRTQALLHGLPDTAASIVDDIALALDRLLGRPDVQLLQQYVERWCEADWNAQAEAPRA